MSTACPWVVPDPACCACWNTTDPRVKERALRWATTVMDARTGRQFGECEVTVRPCGWRDCNSGIEWFGWGWSGSVWMPYILNGQWFNAICACDGLCCCIPDCSVRLAGPISSITQVTRDGDVVDPDTYFVYDNQWLTRVKGNDCWPTCADLNMAPGPGDGVWEVTYKRGRVVPLDVLDAAAVLACEYTKMCAGDSSCRLSSRVISMTRQNLDVQFVSPEVMLQLGLTGVVEVDDIIAAYNPHGLKTAPRVFSPELRYPKQVTWP